MVVAVMLSQNEKKCIEANRSPAKNYYRDAFMTRGPRGKVSLPETFPEPSMKLLASVLYNLWLITFDTFASRNLPGIFQELPECGLHALLREIMQ